MEYKKVALWMIDKSQVIEKSRQQCFDICRTPNIMTQ